ncbi:MAG: FAD-binding oxidoreductase [SAR202 cluster bacterium]|nr:FAD-binding oxidoreductase [SAR202 cluster bacterium]MDP6512444.1 FAD-binding oxidoreductase [SAR202 cluster bacterium]MDP6715642.1 FAD-binding oxidoreductase [SAR202 cluster bacterium]
MRITVKIAAISQETPTIKSFRLDLGGQDFEYRSGQWVDFFVRIDGAEAVGGYSITSNPTHKEYIDLAIKLDGYGVVTQHLHNNARVGDEVDIQVGGDFYYTREMADSIVLLGGGIGLTPLMSIIRYVDENAPNTRLALVYSVQSPSDLLFRDELEAMAERNPRIRNIFSITRPGSEAWEGRTGRIDAKMLNDERIDLDALFFICGPPEMIQSMLAVLRGLDVPESRIRYEQWW